MSMKIKIPLFYIFLIVSMVGCTSSVSEKNNSAAYLAYTIENKVDFPEIYEQVLYNYVCFNDALRYSYVPTYEPVLEKESSLGIAIFNKQEDADNVNLDSFIANSNFTKSENIEIKNLVLNVAMYRYGFDINYNISSFIYAGVAVHEGDIAPNFLFRHSPHSRGFWIVNDFMSFAQRDYDRIFIPVRVRVWPIEQPQLDNGAWLEITLISTDDGYKLLSLLVDA